MEKSEIRIFVVEDDVTMGKALVEALKKEGYTPTHFTNPTDAINQFKIQSAHAFVIDCLLPKISGIELAVQLRKEGALTAPMFLTSGVFKDKAYSKEAIQKTGALNFFNKPFNVSDLIKAINSSFSDFIDEELSPFENLMINSLSPQEKIKSINQLGEIEALDLPLIYCHLMNSKASGILKLSNTKFPMQISFNQGKIVQVEMKNPESFFGHLLIENGYLTPEQLDEALKVESGKRIGEKLVELNYISPHVIDIINSEQMALRLSMSVGNENYNLFFEEKNVLPSASFIDQERLSPFIYDWLNSKFDLAWLKQRYMKWEERPTIINNIASQWLSLWSFPVFKSFMQIVKSFEQGKDLEEIINKYPQNEEVIYQILHILILVEHVKFKNEDKKQFDATAHLARLRKLQVTLQNQDHFAILGISKNAKSTDIKKTYHELAKIFHPDKIPPNSTKELAEAAKNVFGLITKAYEVLSNEPKRLAYIKELEMGRTEKILQGEALFEEGKILLTSGNALKALEKFTMAKSLKPPTSDLLIHTAWALLVSCEQNKNSSQIKESEQILSKIPPEDRHNATYYFVKGYYQKMTNDFVAARKNVQHALSLKPKFIEAERLLRFFDLQKNNKTVDILNSDLKDVVGSLFKKS
ncbi:MAG: response regulator [Oligoflexia bacterium]|nr:response regulator [Oligoflexia bacterium]